ncbi:TetR/AcrR family transcriptional regulator [Mycobacterium sp. CVI_P3]|uniref:TetR/AcrR family transcriptional regulator n=1 Tax=Mycobacterium pinniadriaticum TaxID=2994102 RepID=A0ABT3SIK7_9MYCO|nr:TetR/AcrR family transcriptional regulator [Mycobacterium pinniadriaticum]MCX2932870.1 TetR/AcrR family transcriptional regulator [Mycobacterium pinniadriaticum]MCX2939293.1 TetR/AcrR family transcriptional regulator [Mycobacterium pinniadriaticum]
MRQRKIAPRRPPGGSQLRAERTREAVLDETVRCVIDEGFAAASAKHIAERAGVTWGVVQYHFGDRDGLLMAVVDRGFAEMLDLLRGLPAPSPTQTRRERVELVVQSAWAAFSSPTSRASLEILIGTRAMRDKRATRHLLELQRAITDLGGDIAEGLDSPHATAIGDLIWATMRGLVITQLVMPGPARRSRELAALVDVICSYLDSHGQTR